jgi:hypothetical protein
MLHTFQNGGPTFFHKYVKKSRLFYSGMKINRNTREGREKGDRDKSGFPPEFTPHFDTGRE